MRTVVSGLKNCFAALASGNPFVCHFKALRSVLMLIGVLFTNVAFAQITYYYTDLELHRINLATGVDTLLTVTPGFPTITQSTALAVDNSGNVYFTNQQQIATAGVGITIFQWTPTGSAASTTGALSTLCTLPSTFPASTGPGAWVGQEVEFGRLTYDRATDSFYTLSSLIGGSPNPAVVFRISRVGCNISGVVAVTPVAGVPTTPATGGDLVIVNGRTFVVGSNSTVVPALPTLWEIDEVTGQVLGARTITGCPVNVTNLSGVSLSFDGSLIVSCATAGAAVEVRIIPAAAIAATVTGTGTVASTTPSLSVPSLIGDLGGALTILGVAKTIPSIVVSGPLSYDVTFNVRVQNQGAQLTPNFQVSDRLLNTFNSGSPTIAIVSPPVSTGLFNPATGANTPAAVCAVNPTTYTGVGAVGAVVNNLFDGRQELDLGQGCDVAFTVRVTYPTTANVPTTTLSNAASLGSYGVQPAAGGTGTNPVQTTDGINPKTSSISFLLPQNSDVVVDKVSTPNPYVPGQAVTYTVKVWNKGPNAVTGSTFTDALPALVGGANWTYSCAASGTAGCGAIPTAPTAGTAISAAIGALPVNNVNTPPTAGSYLTITVTATIPSAQTGALNNTANIAVPAGVTDPVPANNSEGDVNAPAPVANLGITKTDGSGTYTAGTAISYTIVASNAGPSDVVGATITDTVPASISGVTWSCVAVAPSACAATSGSGNAISTNANIVAGGSVTYTVSGTVLANTTGNLANTASVAVPTGTTDPTPGNNSATDTDTPAPVADLVVDKTSTPNPYVPGQSLTYTIKVWNKGPSQTTGAAFSDVLPTLAGGASYTYSCAASGSAGCGTLPTTATAAASGATLSGTTGVLPVNASATPPTAGDYVTITVTTTVSPTQTGVLSNSATITTPAGTTDPVPGNNSSTRNSGPPVAAVTIAKTDNKSTTAPGAANTYTITVTNAGPAVANGAVVTDPAQSGLTCSTVTCAVGSGAAVCPASPTVSALQGAGIAIPSLPSGSSVTLTLTCSVTATGL